MEQVKPRKPRDKKSTTPNRDAPPIPRRTPAVTKPVVVNGMQLPAVPAHAPQVQREAPPVPERMRSISPEPEEIEIPEEDVLDADVNSTPLISLDPEPRDIPASSMQQMLPTVVDASRIRNETSAVPISYPSVPALSRSLNEKTFEPTTSMTVPLAPPSYDEVFRERVDAPPMYPSLSDAIREIGKGGLLREDHLATFYHNPMLDTTDRFVEHFVQTQEKPSGPLFGLLKRLKDLCDKMTIAELNEKTNSEALTACLRQCWIINQQSMKYKGRCRENKEGEGTAQYPYAHISKEKMTEMKQLLSTNRVLLMDEKLSNETVFRSLALQIQWEIIALNTQFMGENGLTIQSSPNLVESKPDGMGRTLLLSALADLFFYLRYPSQPQRFVDAVVLWITELVSVLHMCCRCEDSYLILNHILRLPSPVGQWAAPLVQNFVQSSIRPKILLDYAVTVIAYIVNPIRGRESFLRQVVQSENEEQSWAILGGDDEEAEFSFVTITEADLTVLLDQFSITDLYATAYSHFSSTFADRSAQFTAMIAFQLMIMKILNNGLSQYARPGYKQFCRQIAMALRQSVRELGSQWRVVRSVVDGVEESLLQREVDRVVILALGYLIHRQSVGLWQFIVDLPFDCVSEVCRQRCELALRSLEKVNPETLLALPPPELEAKCKHHGLGERIEAMDTVDAVFLVNAMSNVTSLSLQDPTSFLKEIVTVCFCESSRESLYKVGAEGISAVLSRRPESLGALVGILDRQLDHMDNYAVDVLSSSAISGCRLSLDTLTVVGKWLQNNTPDTAGNRLARRLLSGLHWGFVSDGSRLWLEPEVHQLCAKILINAHLAHCTNANGMITKSLKQIAKLASRITDHEQLFAGFCWDLLVKLKLSPKKDSVVEKEKDLAVYFVQLTQCFQQSVSVFLQSGVQPLSDLVASGSAVAAVVALVRVVVALHNDVNALADNAMFIDVVERIVQVDQCSYAVQWLTGPSAERTPCIRLVCSAIMYHAHQVQDMGTFLRAWVELLCVRRPNTWNTDQATLQILGTICRLAFFTDSTEFLGIKTQLKILYEKMVATASENSRGLFSMFSADAPPPAILADTYFGVSVWATYVLLLVEEECHSTFYRALYESMAKKDKLGIEQAVKKAGSKSSVHLPVTQLSVYRWAAFANSLGTSTVAGVSSTLLPLVLQRMAIGSFQLREHQGKKYQLVRRMFDIEQPILKELQKTLASVPDAKGLSHAILGWLFSKRALNPQKPDYSGYNLDYLLQLCVQGDKNLWFDFVDMATIQRESDQDIQVYKWYCHLTPLERPVTTPVTSPRCGRAVYSKPFPCLPSHPGLPPSPRVPSTVLVQQHTIIALLKPFLDGLRKMATEFIDGGDKISAGDSAYLMLLEKLYQPVTKQIAIEIKCHVRCPQPTNTTIQVNTNQYNQPTDAEMTANREKRTLTWTEVYSIVMDASAVQMASVEFIARQLCAVANQWSISGGQAVFGMMTSSVTEVELLFPAATQMYRHTLATLGQSFVRGRPESQMVVMRLVLDGFVLSEPLIEVFTPECLSSAELCDAYKRLSEAVRDPERSSRALLLLGRLGMDYAATQLPPQQFVPLLPVAFRNLTSQPDPGTELHQLCLRHVVAFVFHAFPANFVQGLDIALDGCSTSQTPVGLLERFVSMLSADSFDKEPPHGREYSLPVDKCLECCNVIARRLNDARSRAAHFYAVWARYIDCITQLAQYFLFTAVNSVFNADAPSTVLVRDLAEVFGRISMVFGPLLIPLSPTQPPFTPSHDKEGRFVCERWAQLLALLPYNAAISAGYPNVQSLVWQFYYERLSTVAKGSGQHYYNILSTSLLSLQWSSFGPTPLGVSSLDQCLAEKSSDAAQLPVQIVIRVPWNALLEQMDDEVRASYMARLLSVWARILERPDNYAKSSASSLAALKTLASRNDWGSISAESAECVGKVVGHVLPADTLVSTDEHLAVFKTIWRKTCHFEPKQDKNSPSVLPSIILKQTAHMKSDTSLLLRGGAKHAERAYNSLLVDVNAVAAQQENLRSFCVAARELTVAWAQISDSLFGERLVQCYSSYIQSCPKSPLIECGLQTLIGSLGTNQIETALKVYNKLIASYFTRSGATWTDMSEWIQFPQTHLEASRKYLLRTPSSDNGVQSLPLCLKAFVEFGRPSDSLFKQLHGYIISLKPKHVECDVSLLALLRTLLVWLGRYSASLPTTFPATDDLLPPLIRWLNKSAKDETGILTSIISSKKNAHTPKLRSILCILDLYLCQQTMGDGKKPRCEPGTPVLNSRIDSIREAANIRAFQQYSRAFDAATCYFSDAAACNITHAGALLTAVAKQIYPDNVLNQ